MSEPSNPPIPDPEFQGKVYEWLQGINLKLQQLGVTVGGSLVTDGGAVKAGLALILDSNGKAAGRVLEVDGAALDQLRGGVAAGGETLSIYGGRRYLNFGSGTFVVPTAAVTGAEWEIDVHGVSVTVSREGGGTHLFWNNTSAASITFAASLYQRIKIRAVSATVIRVSAVLRSAEVNAPPVSGTLDPFKVFYFAGAAGAGSVSVPGVKAGQRVLSLDAWVTSTGAFLGDGRTDFASAIAADDVLVQSGAGLNVNSYRLTLSQLA